MTHPVFQNRVLLSLYIFIWTVVSTGIAFAVTPLSLMSFNESIAWGFVSGYVFGGLSLPLWNILKYTDYSSQNLWQATVNYFVLGLMLVGAWLTVIYLFFTQIISSNSNNWFPRLMPFHILLGSCFFVVMVFVYDKWLTKQQKVEEEADVQIVEEEVANEQACEPEEIIERIAIKTKQRIEVVMVSDIVFIQSEGDYAMIHTASARFLKEQTMKYLEKHLPPHQFVRIHRSYIVNVTAISKIELFEKQSYSIVLKNGFQIKASLAGYKLLKSVLNL